VCFESRPYSSPQRNMRTAFRDTIGLKWAKYAQGSPESLIASVTAHIRISDACAEKCRSVSSAHAPNRLLNSDRPLALFSCDWKHRTCALGFQTWQRVGDLEATLRGHGQTRSTHAAAVRRASLSSPLSATTYCDAAEARQLSFERRQAGAATYSSRHDAEM
jgi:hypothetical protein